MFRSKCPLTLKYNYRFFLKSLIFGILFILLSTWSPAQQIYWADIGTNKIQKSNIDGSNPEDVLINLNDPRAIAIDHINGHIYYVDCDNNKIVRIDLDGSNSTDLVISGIGTTYSIELDVARGKMYWADIGNDVIKRANLDGSDVERIISLSSDNPYGIALDLINDKVYWTQNLTDKIRRADLNGLNQEDVISIGLDNPFGIVLDVENDFMYWSETSGDRIARASLSGVGDTTLISSSDGLLNPRQIRIDYINNKLIWTDNSSDKIQSCNIDGSGITDLLTDLNSVYTIFLYDVGVDSKAGISGNWSSSSSWNNGIPNASISNADIAGSITVDGNYSVKNLGIRSGATLTITAGNSLTVLGNITNNSGTDGLILESDDSNTASLIVSGTNSDENITVERYMSGASMGWHLVGVPVTGQSVNDLVTSVSNSISTNNTQYGFGFYNESTDLWTTYTSSTAVGAGNLVPGQGYETIRTTEGDLDFIGTLNTLPVEVSVTKNGNGWNVVGNPYPSSLYANSAADATKNFLTINSSALDDFFEAIYIWNAISSEYEIINQSSGATYIPSGQGFFIKTATAGSISFTPEMRVHQVSSLFKSSKLLQTEITLSLDDGLNKNSTLFKFIDGCSSGLDPGYDAGMYQGAKSDMELYSKILGQEVAYDLQCYALLQEQAYTIPLEIESRQAREISFTSEIINLPEGYHVYLEDREFEILTKVDLPSEYYMASVAKGISKDRFYIRVSKQDLLENKLVENGLEIQFFPDYKQELIRIAGILDSNANVLIYDLSGRLIDSQKLNANTINASQLETGIYILKLINHGDQIIKKLNWLKY